MPKRKSPALPAEAQRALEELAVQLESIANGSPDYLGGPGQGGVVDTLARAVRAAFESGAGSAPAAGRTVTFGQLTAERIRLVRETAGWTQAGLAKAMSAAGAQWKRITVAEVEAGTRRVSLEELMLVSILFAIPMVAFLLPSEGDDGTTSVAAATEDSMNLPEDTRCYRLLSANTIRELVLGEGGIEGAGGTEWKSAAIVAGGPTGDDGWRPAKAFWESWPDRKREHNWGPKTERTQP